MINSLRKIFFLRTNPKACACSKMRKDIIRYLIKKRTSTILSILFLLALAASMFIASKADPKEIFKDIETPDLMAKI